MGTNPPFERLAADGTTSPRITESVLGVVEEVQNPPAPGQVQVRLFDYDGPDDQDGPVWARVAMPLAGSRRGMFMLPDKGDEVLVTFIGGDTRFPVVVGSLWNGQHPPTEEIGERGVDRWSFQSKDGTKISILEESTGSAELTLSVPGGVSAKLKQKSGGRLELKAGGSKVTLRSGGISIKAAGSVDVTGSSVEVTAGTVKVKSAYTDFTGVVNCQAIIATAVVGTIYTPGAGNML